MLHLLQNGIKVEPDLQKGHLLYLLDFVLIICKKKVTECIRNCIKICNYIIINFEG